ncbi:TPA: hypothetical protein ACNVSR_002964 [Klebsiella pneumoniae]|nr:hypothetical protein [Klebsiella pneumoniae]
MTDITELAQLRAELSNPAIGSKDHLRKLALSLVEVLEKAQGAATQQGNIACALLDEVTQLRRHADEKAPELRALLIEADSELEVLRQRIADLESRTVTVKLPENIVDKVCFTAAEIHAQGSGVSDDKAQDIIDRIREILTPEAGIKWEAE